MDGQVRRRGLSDPVVPLPLRESRRQTQGKVALPNVKAKDGLLGETERGQEVDLWRRELLELPRGVFVLWSSHGPGGHVCDLDADQDGRHGDHAHGQAGRRDDEAGPEGLGQGLSEVKGMINQTTSMQ